jgi:heme exporter protein A
LSLLAESIACVRGERAIFAGVSFRLDPGGALLVQGPNGSGKSSLLRLVAGLTPLAAGHLSWDGQPVRENPEAHRARVNYVGHLDALKPALTARENLFFWARFKGLDATAANQAAAAALGRVGLSVLAEYPARLLSAGQKRRLNLARLLLAPTALWLLDEPATGLDSAALAILAGIMSDHRAAGGAVMAATHGDIGVGNAATLMLGESA